MKLGKGERSSRGASSAKKMRRDGRLNVVRQGFGCYSWQDVYARLLTISWVNFLGLTVFCYVASNVLFALAYLIEPGSIKNAQPNSFKDAFYFSIQTMATIGYGAMYPQTDYANIVVAIEALVGLMGVALVTGLAFARLSRPSARVLFSHVAVVTSYEGVPTLMFRAANKRYNQILEARMWVTLARNEVTAEGVSIRRLYDLQLLRSQTPLFSLTWTVFHPIDSQSPLWKATTESLTAAQAELIVILTGLDETVSQTVHARHAFAADDILWDFRFVDIFSSLPDGRRKIDYSRFHNVVPD